MEFVQCVKRQRKHIVVKITANKLGKSKLNLVIVCRTQRKHIVVKITVNKFGKLN